MNFIPRNISALILSGGQGSRMHYQDKGLLEINGLSFVEHIAKQLEQQVNNIYVSTNKNLNQYQSLGFQCISDSPFPSEGPLCAIASGLEKIQCDYLMVVPCDCPNIPEDIVERLYKQMIEKNADIACLSLNGKIEPLFTLINTGLYEKLKQNIQNGLRKTQTWIQNENHVRVESKTDEQYFNINTKEDFLKLLDANLAHK